MSAIAVGVVAAGAVIALAITAGFVAALVLSRRNYSLTSTFKIAPRPVSRQAAAVAEQPSVTAVRDRGAA